MALSLRFLVVIVVTAYAVIVRATALTTAFTTDSGAVSQGVASDGSTGAFVVGTFTSSVTFGSHSLTSSGGTDAFVMHVTSSGSISWAIRVGGGNHDEGRAICADGSGGALVSGYFQYTGTFGGTSLTADSGKNVFVLRVDSGGNIAWVVQSGGTNEEIPEAMVADGSGGALIAGHFKWAATFGSTTFSNSVAWDDVFVCHVTSSGSFAWAVKAGGDCTTGADRTHVRAIGRTSTRLASADLHAFRFC